MKNSTKFLYIIFILIGIIYIIGFLIRFNFRTPYYMVFIVPNHGGKYAPASSIDGDWYNPVTKKYSMDYIEGLYYNDFSEFGLLLKLSWRITKLLEKSKHSSQWKDFENVLKKYSLNSEFNKIILDPELTKKESYKSIHKEDVNSFFRIMDFPAHSIFKKFDKGIISKINKFKAEFVLTLDLNYKNKEDNSIFAIVTPSYNFYNYIRKKLIKNDLMFNEYTNIINNYYGKTKSEKIKNIISDTYLYFTGYLPDTSLKKIDKNKFIGLGYNMVTWDWRDDSNWYKYYNEKEKYPWYNTDLAKFSPGGNFWLKEKSNYELWKREKSNFKYGDEYYIAETLLKIMKYVLNEKNIKFSKVVYDFNPFSLYTTGLVINLNLGSIYDKNTRDMIINNTDKLSESIAIALYAIANKNGIILKNKEKIKGIDIIKYTKDKYIGRRKRRY